MKEKLEAFKQVVIENSNNPDFTYREWFIADHMIIVERIAMELCDIYTKADRDVVFALVWFHDFGKPIDEKNEREITKTKGSETMRKIGFTDEFIEKVLSYWTRMEMKEEIDISKEAIEVQIVSTADGASHFVGKFYASYFYRFPGDDLKSLEKTLKAKIKKDWERKIVLPEVKEAFKERYIRALEIVGDYSNKFITTK